MLVPVVSAASTSPSPTNVPPAIFTVAPVQVGLSGSVTETVGDSTIEAPFSVKLVLVVPSASVGASLTAVTLIVVVVIELRLLEPLPSLSSQVTVRVGLAPRLV